MTPKILSKVGIASRVVALIAFGEHTDPIADRMRKAETAIAVFSGVEDLLGEPEQPAFSAIILWAEDVESAPARLIEPLTRCFEQTPIVMVCMSIERWAMRAALAAGATGVVLFDDLNAALVPCLQAVEADQTCVPSRHWRQIAPPALSSREKQILGLVAMGYTNSQIAAQLFLAESTVKSHLSSAFGKLGVRSRNEAISLILDPDRGLGIGILALGGEPMQLARAAQ